MLQGIKNVVQGGLHRVGYHLAPHRPYSAQSVSAARISSWEQDGVPVSFLVVDEIDNVQAEHLQQKFYAPDELRQIASVFPKGGVFLDVGANVGNHSIYAALFMAASKVISVEPNPAAYRILRANAGLNGVQTTIAHHPVGLSNRAGRAVSMTPDHNLGGTHLTRADEGALILLTGDELLAGEKVDFIKIDTEGMEIEALEGLADTIRNHRPILFVEVDCRNSPAFENLTSSHDYVIRNRHPGLGWQNILALPA